ncbi:hypothetical protein V8E54_008193 [Elaphomyces granulatus]
MALALDEFVERSSSEPGSKKSLWHAIKPSDVHVQCSIKKSSVVNIEIVAIDYRSDTSENRDRETDRNREMTRELRQRTDIGDERSHLDLETGDEDRDRDCDEDEIEIVGIDRGRESLDSISSHDFDLRGLRSGDEIEISLDLVVVPLISRFRSVSDLVDPRLPSQSDLLISISATPISPSSDLTISICCLSTISRFRSGDIGRRDRDRDEIDRNRDLGATLVRSLSPLGEDRGTGPGSRSTPHGSGGRLATGKPARFWKKYRSCGGNSPSGVGERLFFEPFGLPGRCLGVSVASVGALVPLAPVVTISSPSSS